MKLSYFPLFILISIIFLVISCDDDSPNNPATEDGNIGALELSIDEIIVNTQNTIQVKLTVPSNISVQDSLVKLVKVDNSNNMTELGFLADNGDLYNFGDEIIGDNIYSGIINFSESAVGETQLVAIASATMDGNPINGSSEKITIKVYSDLTTEEFDEVVNTQENATEKLNELLGGSQSNFENAFDQTVQWLKDQSQIENVEHDGTTSIRIKYKSGLEGGMIISVENELGQINTKGGKQFDDRKSKKQIPLYKQTVGTNFNYNQSGKSSTFKYSDLSDELIGNRNVMIYSPYEAYFPVDMRPSIQAIISKSDYEFSVSTFINQAANVAVLKTITDYGLIIFDTHGSGGKYLLTGEIADTNAAVYKDSYKALIKANKLAIFKNVTISAGWFINRKENIYAVSYKFFQDLSTFFPNSVIFNGSCESNKTTDFADEFMINGANAYYGFSKVVNVTFCAKMADSVVKRLTIDLKNTSEAFTLGQIDPESPNAVYQYEEWINPVHYPSELINGDFEFGKIDGWTKEGDGRVISKLVTQSPTGGSYMGIISTGLGFTTTTGKIFQSFRIENNQSSITVKWNFLSEEFLEFINSSFQDYFKVIVKKKDGTEVELLNKSIDIIASEFGAQKFTNTEGEEPQPGDLISTTAIVFDRGDVYITGWQTSTFDVSAFRNEIITLILLAGDVGDSIYDTAILIDDIKVN